MVARRFYEGQRVLEVLVHTEPRGQRLVIGIVIASHIALVRTLYVRDPAAFGRHALATEGVRVVPDDALLEMQMRTLPTVGSLLPADSTCGLVAGARYVPLQIEIRPIERFVAGLRRVA